MIRVAVIGSAGLPVVVGDASDPGTVAEAVRDADLVVCALGGDADGCLRATRVLVDALRKRGPRRIIAITGAMVGHPPEELPWLHRAIRAAPRPADTTMTRSAAQVIALVV